MSRPPAPLDYASPPAARVVRLAVWVCVVALHLCGTIFWIHRLSGAAIYDNDLVLVGGWILLGLTALAIALLLRTTPPDAIRIPPRASAVLIVGAAVLLHSFAIWRLWPALSEDVARYKLEGRMWRESASPYAHSPHDFLQLNTTKSVPDWITWQAGFIGVLTAHPQLPSIYPPVAQATFFGCSLGEHVFPRQWWFCSGAGVTSFRDVAGLAALDAGLLTFRLFYSACCVLAVVVTIDVLQRIGRSVWWATVFGWHPLVILETGAMIHVDIVGVMLMLACVWLALLRKPALSGAALALAVGVKPFALLLLPFLARDLRASESARPSRAVRRTLMGFALAIGLTWLPALSYQHGYRGFLHTLHVYSTTWEFNGPVYESIKAIFGEGDEGRNMERAKSAARRLAVAATLVTAALLWWRRATMVRAGYGLFLIALLFSPVVYPWYLLWMLCFVPLLCGEAGWTGLAWSATVGISYIVWHEPAWRVPAWAMWAQYAPVVAAICAKLFQSARRPHPLASRPR